MRISRRGLTACAAAALTAGIVAGPAAPVAARPRAAAPGHTAAPASRDIAVSDPPATTYRIPDIAVTTHGTILLAYDRRNGSAGDLPNDIDTLVVRSTDGGRTWSAPVDAVDYPAPAGCGDSSMVVDRRTGRVLLFCTYSAGQVGYGNSQPGTADTTDPHTLHVQVRHSDDDGRTWSAPTDLNPQVKDVAWRGYFASSGHGLQTAAGRLIQPVAVHGADDKNHFADLYSDDRGATWHRGALSGPGNNESKALQLANGTVVQNIRPVSAGYRLIATSTDGGATFSPSRPDPRLPDPSVNADEIRVNPGRHGPHRHWLLFVNPADQLARRNLTIRLSCDDGATWPVQRLLHAGPAGYAAMAMLPDGRVGVFYENGTSSSTEKLTFTTLDPRELGARCHG